MSAPRRAAGGSRFLYDSFEAAALHLEAQERIFEARKEALEFRLSRLENGQERLEKRLWIAVYSVAGGVVLHGALAFLPLLP